MNNASKTWSLKFWANNSRISKNNHRNTLNRTTEHGASKTVHTG